MQGSERLGKLALIFPGKENPLDGCPHLALSSASVGTGGPRQTEAGPPWFRGLFSNILFHVLLTFLEEDARALLELRLSMDA